MTEIVGTCNGCLVDLLLGGHTHRAFHGRNYHVISAITLSSPFCHTLPAPVANEKRTHNLISFSI